MRALLDLPQGSEITFNYNDNELPMAAPFEINGVAVTGRAAPAMDDSSSGGPRLLAVPSSREVKL